MCHEFDAKEYKIADDSWMTEFFNESSIKVIGDPGVVIG